MKRIDDVLNAIAMYRVVLYVLLALAAISLIFSLTGILFYKPLPLVLSLLILLSTCYISNLILEKIFNAETNIESWAITGLILFFIMTPVLQSKNIAILILAGAVAMSSKYIFAVNKKHIFNPAACAAFLIGVLGFGNASWWIGTNVMLIFVGIGGFLIVRKIRRSHLFFSFLIASLTTLSIVGLANKLSFQNLLAASFTSWPLIFFGTVMVTEPLTTPPTKKLQLIYGGLVGILFGLPFQLGPISGSPELALLIGNLFSYAVSSRQKLFLNLKEKRLIAQNTFEFIFASPERLAFKAGQYIEWTLPHKNADSRGNRRYFTLASSPTEDTIRLAVRIEENPSSFKRELKSLTHQKTIVAASLAGDFTLPESQHEKLAFIAGGIGITPFRSMIKYLIDKSEKREVILFYTNKRVSDIAYKDIFDEAQKKIGLETQYLLSDKENAPKDWNGMVGRLDKNALVEKIPDFKDRTFYISGPDALVTAYKNLLLSMDINKRSIRTDYFPGY